MAGERQIGQWRLLGQIGRGGTGAVYQAVSVIDGRRAAVKQWPASQAGASPRLDSEARLLARLVHPNIVRLIDVISTADGEYLVLELVEGESLRERIRRGRLTEREALAVMLGILAALDHAHRRSVIHLDMKPENALLGRSGEVKVADFGVARLARRTRPAGGATALGTPHYMSPEQAKGEAVDARSDLYSAGVVLYELFCGRPPFGLVAGGDAASVVAQHVLVDPAPPSSHGIALDGELEAVILKSLAKAPADRHQTAADFREQLAKIASRLPGEQSPTSDPHQPERSGWTWLQNLLARR